MQEFNPEAVKARFLEEVARLKENGAFLTEAEFCKKIKVAVSFLSELKRDRPYHVTLKNLHYAREVYKMNIWYVITGERTTAPLKPAKSLKELSLQGAHLRKREV